MTTTVAEGQIAGIERRLDYIVEELANMKRARTQDEKLIAELPLVAKEALGEATAAPGTINLAAPEIVQLLRTALLDAKLLTAAMQQLESANDFIADVHPVIRDVYQKALAGCEVLQKKGYFGVASAGMRISDTLVSSLSVQDLKHAEAVVPQLLGLVRDVTHPEVLQAVEAILHGFGKVHGTITANKSVFAIVRDINSPDARRGITILVEFLKVLGAASRAVGQTAAHAATTLER